MDIWLVSRFSQLCVKALWTFIYKVCSNICFHFSWVNTKLYGSIYKTLPPCFPVFAPFHFPPAIHSMPSCSVAWSALCIWISQVEACWWTCSGNSGSALGFPDACYFRGPLHTRFGYCLSSFKRDLPQRLFILTHLFMYVPHKSNDTYEIGVCDSSHDPNFDFQRTRNFIGDSQLN